MRNNNFQKTKDSRGFVILFAITLSSILLSIAIGATNIALQEIKFGTSNKGASDAFMAADTGIECALFHDKLVGSFFPIAGPAGPATKLTCASATAENITPIFTGTPDTGSYTFAIVGLGSSGKSCAKVTVFKNRQIPDPGLPGTTTVTSKGYDVGDLLCDPINPNRVERELKTTYYIGVEPTPP